jgi:ribosomal protein S27E
MSEVGSDRLRLTQQSALGAICAVLPLNAVSFAPRLKEDLWPAWMDEVGRGDEATLREQDFLRPGGMLSWLSHHLIELKIENHRNDPPRIGDARAWFRHFNYSSSSRLQKHELLRGVVKTCVINPLASPRNLKACALKLHDLVQDLWNDVRWEDGVPLDDFEGPSGLAERILETLPGATAAQSTPGHAKGGIPLSAEEALAEARKEDFAHVEESEVSARQRTEARQRITQQAATATRPSAASTPEQRAGSDLLLTSLLEAATQIRSAAGDNGSVSHSEAPSSEIRIRCPFCQAVNACSASPGHRVICGGCRSVFAVPSWGNR